MPATDDAITLREYLDREIASVRRDINLITATIDKTADAHQKSHDREHQMTAMAVTKAEESMTGRLEAMNQFRAQITEERATYLTKAEFVRFEEENKRRHQEHTTGMQTNATLWANLQGRVAGVGILIGILTLVSMFLALWAKIG